MVLYSLKLWEEEEEEEKKKKKKKKKKGEEEEEREHDKSQAWRIFLCIFRPKQ